MICIVKYLLGNRTVGMNKDTRLSGVLHVLLHLDHAKNPLTSTTLAKTMDTNPAVFRRMMAGLRDAGIVRSDRGPGGGWKLEQPLDKITLLDVYKAIGQSEIFCFGLRNDSSDCKVELAVNDVLSEAMDDAKIILLRQFDEIFLSQIAKQIDVSA